MRKVTLDQYVKEIQALPEEIEAACVRGLREAALRGVSHVVSQIESVDAVSEGGLKDSVRSVRIPKGALLTVDAPHAPMIEYGTRPHWPPEEPIRAWVRRKIQPADEDEEDDIVYGVRFSIASFGIEPRHYFRDAMKQVTKDVDTFIRQELRRL